MGAFSEMVEAMGTLQIEASPAYPLNDIGTAKLFHDLCNVTACYVQRNCGFSKRSQGELRFACTYLMAIDGVRTTVDCL